MSKTIYFKFKRDQLEIKYKEEVNNIDELILTCMRFHCILYPERNVIFHIEKSDKFFNSEKIDIPAYLNIRRSEILNSELEIKVGMMYTYKLKGFKGYELRNLLVEIIEDIYNKKVKTNLIYDSKVNWGLLGPLS